MIQESIDLNRLKLYDLNKQEARLIHQAIQIILREEMKIKEYVKTIEANK